DGSRVNAIIPPLSLVGPVITIRKFPSKRLEMRDLIGFGTLSEEMAKFLDGCVKARLNIFISGGTGSGKTTLLNVLSSFIPNDDRIVTIEDAAELQLMQDHVISLETRPPNIEGKGAIAIRDLVRNSLRMRPDRVVIGEVRSSEALDMLQAMNTGHDGSLATGHANTPRDMLSRLETMVLMAGMDLPVRAIREQISSAVDLIIQQSRLKDGSRKITHITEVIGMEGDTIILQDLFTFKQTGTTSDGKIEGRHSSTGIRPYVSEKLENYGIDLPSDWFNEV
ncbi:CpaF family protein, partial [Paenibacillus phytohabitans]